MTNLCSWIIKRKADPIKSGVDFGRFHPCEGNFFELWSAFLSVHQYYFNEAAAAYQYVLLDLDGNGFLELITQEVEPSDPQHSTDTNHKGWRTC